MKIDLDWIQEELNAGRDVELECVDEEGLLSDYTDSNKELLRGALTVEEVKNHAIYIKNCTVGIVDNEFKHFRIKQYPTFDDLIDVAVKAVKNRVLFTMSIGDDKRKGRYLNYVVNGNSPTESFYESDDDYQYCIDFINSLYIETFVIESDADIDKVNCNANIKLLNGMHIETSSNGGDGCVSYFSEESADNYVDFIFLKGATVTQRKGNK